MSSSHDREMFWPAPRMGRLRFQKTSTGNYLAIHSKIAPTTITVPRIVGIRQKSFNRLMIYDETITKKNNALLMGACIK